VEVDDVGRVRVKTEMQFISMTQKLLEGGEPALVRFGTSVYLGQKPFILWRGILLHFKSFTISISSI
jgi:hypothetical protein